MEKITVDPSLGRKLSAISGSAILCDSDGRVIGFFSPMGDQVRLEDLQLEPPLSIAETEALRKDRSGKPLEEILRRLGVL